MPSSHPSLGLSVFFLFRPSMAIRLHSLLLARPGGGQAAAQNDPRPRRARRDESEGLTRQEGGRRALQQSSLARHWARDWRALALTQVHHGSRLSDSREDGEALRKKKRLPLFFSFCTPCERGGVRAVVPNFLVWCSCVAHPLYIEMPALFLST